MKKICVTHCDLDMAGSIMNLIYFNKYKDYDHILVNDYKSYENGSFDYSLVEQADEVLYMDMTPDQKSLDIIIEKNIKCTILDHHSSFMNDTWIDLGYSERDLPNMNYVFDNEKSGSMISYEYFKAKHKGRVPKMLHEIVEIIDNYDLWKDETEMFEAKSMNMNRLFWKSLEWGRSGINKYIPFIEDMLNRVKNNVGSFQFTRKDRILIDEARVQERQAMVKASKTLLVRKDNKGYKFGIIKARAKISIVAYRYLQGRKDLDYIVAINEYNSSDKRISLRSQKHINLLEVIPNAKGHQNSAGLKDYDKDFPDSFYNGKPYALN
jgi:oligoribonuclease NrnB/cAMP/cGMP phosphodiesterase (DHH superfamily)